LASLGRISSVISDRESAILRGGSRGSAIGFVPRETDCGVRRSYFSLDNCAHECKLTARHAGITCLAALETATCAAFIKESRMERGSATNTNRKSGTAIATKLVK
jgi:hypothetical protein